MDALLRMTGEEDTGRPQESASGGEKRKEEDSGLGLGSLTRSATADGWDFHMGYLFWRFWRDRAVGVGCRDRHVVFLVSVRKKTHARQSVSG